MDFRGLTDSRQLFPAQHVHDAVAADAALQDYRAAGALFHSADSNGSLRDCDSFHHFESLLGLRCRDKHRKTAFIRHVQRIEAENFAGALNNFIDRNRDFFQIDADLAVASNLVQGRRQAATGQVAQAVNLDSGIQECFDRGPDVVGVAENWGLELQSLAHGENCNAVTAEIAADDDHISGLNRLWTDRSFHVRFDQPNPRSVNENAVAFALVDDFRVAG